MIRLIVIPVMFLYLIAVSGVMIQLHYCGQELESWKLFAKSDGCAGGECGDERETNDSCCENKVVAAKVSHEQNTVDGYKLKLINCLPDLHTPLPQLRYTAITPLSVEGVSYHPNAPPGLWQQIPLYELFSSFTYYG